MLPVPGPGDPPRSLVHVAHVVLSLHPGGTENGVVNVVNRLDPQRFRSSVCCLGARGIFADRLHPRVDVALLPRRPGFDLTLLWRLTAQFRAGRPDVVHTRNPLALVYGAMAARLAGVRGIVHGVHGCMPAGRARRLVHGFLASRVHARVAVSQELGRMLRQEAGLGTGSVEVVNNGVDCERFRVQPRDAARQRLDAPLDRLVIGAVGRLDRAKDHQTLLRAAGALDGEAEIWLVGEGAERGPLEATARTCLPPGRVRFLGHREDVADILPALDVFVLPSLTEGLPNVLLEAMACGLPVIASRVGGNVEVVTDGETGLLFTPGDPEDLRRCLERLGRDPVARRALGERAWAHVRQRFSLDTMVRAYERVYAGVMAGR